MKLHVIDATTRETKHMIQVGTYTYTFTVTPDSRTLIVLTKTGPHLQAFDLLTGSKTADLPLPPGEPGADEGPYLPRRVNTTLDSRFVVGSIEKSLIVWDLLWHHTTWFDLKTGRLAPHPVSVVGPAALAPDPPDAFSQPGDGSLVYLPIIRTESRRSVWNVGWHSFLHRPLFGGGQHAIRADYASETSPAPGQPAPSHAHNLLLELLDNWGVVGTVLLATLLAALWWPLVAATFHRRVLSRWHIALLAAAFALLAHETVDYFLGSTSVFVLVWILTGLASAGLADETSPSVIPSNSSNARDPRR